MKDIALKYGERVYRVSPDMPLICRIEEELGSTIRLLRGFSSDQWRMSDLVSLIHMALCSAGRTIDFHTLGNKILSEGPAPYLSFARAFLARATGEAG